ncbi:MAG: polyphosphate kinase 1 [Bacteroidetes bacterium GWF2_43_63]|nr:MAG: polyphosphate kinase 1 [Bacteroidetes bacterium GWE2_42_42]OFY53425.1 MAG: polyphosphate kinase 1 [Bacteroidetes bacterium GWF2_43_63]HBG69401.1 polyphosphate kinase 1 [Bacteroidales bacterium]HCB62020.1 polyphosphate kinase 1 [Bacteroidales bacterium]HCY23144.1 polyphosphate kinase 1 [Bacteroidales bacterium]
MKKQNHSVPAVYVNRELSWLDFNDRVLQEAECVETPILERIKFLGIFSNNQDEFFRVRVATLKRIVKFRRKSEYEYSHYFSPQSILAEINQRILGQQKRLAQVYNHLVKELAHEGVHLINEKEVKHAEHKSFVKYYFNNVLRTYVFPIIMKSFKAESMLRDKSIYLAVSMRNSARNAAPEYALLEVPSEQLSRFVVLPEKNGEQFVMFIDDIIRYCMADIFKSFDYDEFNAYTIKFTRDAELEMDSDISKSFLEIISDSLKQRKTGNPVRFVVDRDMPEVMLDFFFAKIGLTRDDTLVSSGRYHNFKDLMNFPFLGKEQLIFKEREPVLHARLELARSIFDEVKKKDILLSFPQHPFKYIIDFLREASIDPAVRSIKMTIYRIGKNSNVINALINAARNGKNVTVFMELQARFDEETNIYWSTKLQEEGVRVIHSIPGLKVHTKLISVKRTEGKKSVYYTNVGTGNFNEYTASLYCDVSIMTADQTIGIETAQVFEMFEASYRSFSFKHLVVSPMEMRPFVEGMIDKLTESALRGEEAYAAIKLNNIVDKDIADRIYAAARAGVKFDIICRSACVLQPINENLRIISIVGRNLEHSRIIYFRCGQWERVYITSADWMKRNMDRRIEVLCPVLDNDAADLLKNILSIHIKDNEKARFVNGKKNNTYVRNNDTPFDSQDEVYKLIKSGDFEI